CNFARNRFIAFSTSANGKLIQRVAAIAHSFEDGVLSKSAAFLVVEQFLIADGYLIFTFDLGDNDLRNHSLPICNKRPLLAGERGEKRQFHSLHRSLNASQGMAAQ